MAEPHTNSEGTESESRSTETGSELPKHVVPVSVESARAVQLQMMWSPDGPNATPDSEYRLLACGSAFMYRIADHLFIVTARHNLTGRHWQTNEFLGDITTEPTHLRFALLPKEVATGVPLHPSPENPRLAAMSMLMPSYTLPLVGEDWIPIWKQHPDLGSAMDVAAVPFSDPRGHALITAWEPPINEPATVGVKWPALSQGQDIVIVGYPLGLVTGPLLPLWMRGMISSEPAMGHVVDDQTRPLMVVDARTRKGSSGSAVMRHRPEGSLVTRTDGKQGITLGSYSELIGVYSGRTHSDSDLGYVWRIDVVDPICTAGVPGTI